MSERKEMKDMTPEEIDLQARENAHVFMVQSLALTLLYAKKNYYNGYICMVDESYDKLEQELKRLCPGHPVLEAVGNAGFEGNHLGIADTRALVKRSFTYMKAPDGGSVAVKVPSLSVDAFV